MACPSCSRPFAHPSPVCPRWAEHDAAGFDDWPAYERATGERFRAWATGVLPARGGERVRYAVLQPEPGSGLVWVRLAYFDPLPGSLPLEVRRSRGFFYDGAADHPEGGLAWATAWAREHAVVAREPRH